MQHISFCCWGTRGEQGKCTSTPLELWFSVMSLCPVSFKKPFFINIYSVGHKGSCCSACSVCIVVLVTLGFNWRVYRKRVAETWPALPSFKISNKFNMFYASIPLPQRLRKCVSSLSRGFDEWPQRGRIWEKCITDARCIRREETG